MSNIEDILRGLNESECDCDPDNSCKPACERKHHHNNNNNNSWLLILLLLFCGNGNGCRNHMTNNCGCGCCNKCCCDPPKFKKCTETYYYPVNDMRYGYGYGDPQQNNNGFMWIILLLLLCGNKNGNGCGSIC